MRSVWPVESASKGAVAPGQWCYTEAYRLWHPLMWWPSSGSLMNMAVFFRFRLFELHLSFCCTALHLFVVFLMCVCGFLATEFVFVLSFSVLFYDLFVQMKDTSVTVETWATVFSSACQLWLIQLISHSSPLKLLLQGALHWYTAGTITTETRDEYSLHVFFYFWYNRWTSKLSWKDVRQQYK